MTVSEQVIQDVRAWERVTGAPCCVLASFACAAALIREHHPTWRVDHEDGEFVLDDRAVHVVNYNPGGVQRPAIAYWLAPEEPMKVQ